MILKKKEKKLTRHLSFDRMERTLTWLGPRCNEWIYLLFVFGSFLCGAFTPSVPSTYTFSTYFTCEITV